MGDKVTFELYSGVGIERGTRASIRYTASGFVMFFFVVWGWMFKC